MERVFYSVGYGICHRCRSVVPESGDARRGDLNAGEDRRGGRVPLPLHALVGGRGERDSRVYEEESTERHAQQGEGGYEEVDEERLVVRFGSSSSEARSSTYIDMYVCS